MKIKLILTLGWISYCFAYSQAQNAQIHITGGYMNIDGISNIVLNNAKWINDGTFNAGLSTITFTGNNSTNLATIAGNSPTIFYQLTLNKSSNDVELEQDISIIKRLELTNNSLVLDNNNLSLQTNASIANADQQRYLKTTGSGRVIQEVANGSSKNYPVGNGSYTPLTIENNGTTDEFGVRVQNQLYSNGTTGNVITSDAVNRSWVIDEKITGGSVLDLTFSWNNGEELANFDRNNCFVTAFQAGTWQSYSNQIATGINPYQATIANITDLSVFGIASDGGVLPVELLYFTGEKINEGTLLSWETATELNNKGFEVQVNRSSSLGLEWETLDFINGNGTTQTPQQYQYLDTQSEIGINYYRLKQMDFDGNFIYSDILPIEYDNENALAFSVFPNPTTNYLTIEANTKIRMLQGIEIYNINGQLVRQLKVDNKTRISFDLNDLPNGTYIIRINNQVNKRIIKID